ncbi:LPS export ABC transporter permease LptG [Roseateles chitosanitabidus]|jgi:lipopolysaccharide export system permease protein|uniref:LPS export ABC transporter permease LptG n=1 Tax=Roseateles chitosanitabidus TaxID=65048 RepID=UPI00083558B9|nr:LPS export ABC transporter permease LptG [Roseateles chitosanitabidus]MBO9685698.1 LPS export ABC transporter permease LptG [Roseateles chitosanitabidus]
MRTVRRLLYRDILSSFALVMAGFLALFFFVDFIDDLDRFQRLGLGVGLALWSCVLKLPGRFYELMPIAVLIGTIFSLARLAQSSEFTILRTGGLGPQRALALLSTLALGFAVLAFVVGDFVNPWADKQAQLLKSSPTGVSNSAGAWMKDRDGDFSYAVHVGRARTNGTMEDVLVYEFDAKGAMATRLTAKNATVDASGRWQMNDVSLMQWSRARTPLSAPAAAAPQPKDPAAPQDKLSDNPTVREILLPSFTWQSQLPSGVVSAAVQPTWNMSTLELYRYTRHLSSQEQSSAQPEIQFWRKAFYPFACMVMVALALPFAYLHFRSGGISVKVFGGIMLGISFVVLNAITGHLGLLRDWTPWLVASAPSLFYLGISMAAFYWLVRYR